MLTKLQYLYLFSKDSQGNRPKDVNALIRGIKVNSISIQSVCDDAIKMLATTMTRHEIRTAFTVASRLFLMVVVVYRKKVMELFQETKSYNKIILALLKDIAFYKNTRGSKDKSERFKQKQKIFLEAPLSPKRSEAKMIEQLTMRKTTKVSCITIRDYEFKEKQTLQETEEIFFNEISDSELEYFGEFMVLIRKSVRMARSSHTKCKMDKFSQESVVPLMERQQLIREQALNKNCSVDSDSDVTSQCCEKNQQMAKFTNLLKNMNDEFKSPASYSTNELSEKTSQKFLSARNLTKLFNGQAGIELNVSPSSSESLNHLGFNELQQMHTVKTLLTPTSDGLSSIEVNINSDNSSISDWDYDSSSENADTTNCERKRKHSLVDSEDSLDECGSESDICSSPDFISQNERRNFVTTKFNVLASFEDNFFKIEETEAYLYQIHYPSKRRKLSEMSTHNTLTMDVTSPLPLTNVQVKDEVLSDTMERCCSGDLNDLYKRNLKRTNPKQPSAHLDHSYAKKIKVESSQYTNSIKNKRERDSLSERPVAKKPRLETSISPLTLHSSSWSKITITDHDHSAENLQNSPICELCKRQMEITSPNCKCSLVDGISAFRDIAPLVKEGTILPLKALCRNGRKRLELASVFSLLLDLSAGGYVTLIRNSSNCEIEKIEIRKKLHHILNRLVS